MKNLFECKERDKNRTIKNRNLLLRNKNLLYWYKNLFHLQVDASAREQKNILEIGSGTSPVTIFFPEVKTSDVMNMDHVDYVFDCHHIDSVDEIVDGSLDLIIMTNVLHHLKDPVLFLSKAAVKLKSGGMVVATEPYFSFFSQLIYKYCHHEGMDLTITKPCLDNIIGPLSSSNIALPYLIFYKHIAWQDPLLELYDMSISSYYTSMSYFATGGISRKIPVPFRIYQLFFWMDYFFSEKFPRLFASFFIVQLTRK